MDGHASVKRPLNRWAKTDDVVTRRIAGEIIVVPITSRVADLDSIYTLNESGSRIWELIDGQKRVCDIIDSLCEEYDVEIDEAASDVHEFLSALEAAGLIACRGEMEE